MSLNLSVTHSGEAEIDGLLLDFNWNLVTAPGNTISYAFAAGDIAGTDRAETAMSLLNQAAVRSVLAEASGITGIQFAQSGDAASADIVFAVADLEEGSAGLTSYGYTYGYDRATGAVNWVDGQAFVWLDPAFTNTVAGTFDYQVVLHETGHALGLEHPFDSGAYPGGQDSWDYTVMSYTAGSTGYQSHFQENDVAALEYIYCGDGLGGRSYVLGGDEDAPLATVFSATQKTAIYLADALTGAVPTADAFADYSSLLDAGTSAADLAADIIADLGIDTDRDAFLHTLYANVHGRAPTADELSWVKANWHSLTPGDVAANMATDGSQATLLAQAVAGLEQQGFDLAVVFSANQKTAIYLAEALTGAVPAADAFADYSSLLDAGTSAADLAADIIADLGIDTDRDAFLDTLYNNINGRDPTADELSWIKANWHNSAPGDVAAALATDGDQAALLAPTIAGLEVQGFGFADGWLFG